MKSVEVKNILGTSPRNFFGCGRDKQKSPPGYRYAPPRAHSRLPPSPCSRAILLASCGIATQKGYSILFACSPNELRSSAITRRASGASRPRRQKKKTTRFGWFLFLVAGRGFEPPDLRVMSPTSYQAALPRDIFTRAFLLRAYHYIIVKAPCQPLF